MLFQRRRKENFKQRVRIALWPRRTWWRSVRYMMLRVLRLTASPHVIAMGMAAGVFASFTPFLGFHFVIAFAICFFTRGSYFAGITGTFFGNPLTFPFIWASVLSSGRFILHFGDEQDAPPMVVPELSADIVLNSFHTVWPVIKAMTIGAFPVGIPVAIICYFIVRQMARFYQKSRLKMLADKARSNWADKIDQKLQDDYEADISKKLAEQPVSARNDEVVS